MIFENQLEGFADRIWTCRAWRRAKSPEARKSRAIDPIWKDPTRAVDQASILGLPVPKVNRKEHIRPLSYKKNGK
ncbi:MAG TPA: hypothetical protein DCM41_02735 [Synergistaceae bacterium]|nr:hypothetical protein [Synergistaceae bacterium]